MNHSLPKEIEAALKAVDKPLRCSTIHSGERAGYTCLDKISESEQWIADYTTTGNEEQDRILATALTYRKAVVAGKYACPSCVAKRSLTTLRDTISRYVVNESEVGILAGVVNLASYHGKITLDTYLKASAILNRLFEGKTE